MIEEIRQWWKQFSMKGWLLYYAERRKNVKERGLQHTSHPTKIKDGKLTKRKPRSNERHNPQSNPHAIPKSDDSRTVNNNS